MNVAGSARDTLVRLPAEPIVCHNFVGRELAMRDGHARIEVTTPVANRTRMG
jgi:hypothetical protein